MNILIVDDEALARQRLSHLLADCSAWPAHSVAEAASSTQALALLSTGGGDGSAFDLVLLDIHMPGLDGVALAHRMRALPCPPTIVFVTAHAEYALDAFELDAADYLTKPVRLARLQQALGKAQRLRETAAPSQPAEGPPEGDSLLIQDRGRTERVPLAEILVCKAELKYVTVRTALRSYITDSTLSQLEARHAEHLLRVHRNALVARRAVRAIEKHFDPVEGDCWAVRVAGLNELVPVSRRQVAAVREELAREG